MQLGPFGLVLSPPAWPVVGHGVQHVHGLLLPLAPLIRVQVVLRGDLLDLTPESWRWVHYCDRWGIEVAFSRLEAFRRVAARYRKLALNFRSAGCLAAIIAFWV